MQEFTLGLGGEAFLATARVLHCQPSPDGDGFDLGLQLVGQAPRDEERLRACLARQPRWPR